MRLHLHARLRHSLRGIFAYYSRYPPHPGVLCFAPQDDVKASDDGRGPDQAGHQRNTKRNQVLGAIPRCKNGLINPLDEKQVKEEQSGIFQVCLSETEERACVPSDVQLFVENGGGERGGEHGAERGEHGGVERAPHRDAPRLQVEHHA